MSTSTAGNDRRRQASTWVAHRAPWIMFAVTVVIIAGRLHTANSLLALLWHAALAAGIVVSWISGGHSDVLCQVCVAAVPLDPTPGVVRYRWALWIHHRRNKFLAAAFLVGLAVWMLPFSWSIGFFDAVVVYGTLIVVFRADLIHRPLVRGCPECRGWRGDSGDGQVVSTPDPLPVGQKTH